MHVIAAKAVAFAEALQPEFKLYIQQVVNNARALADTLQGTALILFRAVRKPSGSGGFAPKGLTGDVSENALERANITCNKNGVPFDPKNRW